MTPASEYRFDARIGWSGRRVKFGIRRSNRREWKWFAKKIKSGEIAREGGGPGPACPLR